MPSPSPWLLLSSFASDWQLFGRLARARHVLSAPADEDPVGSEWLEAEMSEVVTWRHDRCHPPPPCPDDDDQLDAVPSTASPGLICVSSATYLHLMRTLEMIVVSLAPLGSFEAELTTAEAAAVFAAFCREWHVFTRLAHDAAILGRAFDDLDRVLDDLPVWSYDDPQPPLAVFASERNRQLAELIE